MTDRKAEQTTNLVFNRYLALGIGIVAALASLTLVVFVLVLPDDSLEALDEPTIKAVIIGLGLAIIAFCGILIYFVVHTPTAKRLTFATWQGIFIYTVSVGSFSVFGWPRIKSIVATRTEGIRAEFGLVDVAREVWPTLAVCLTALIVITCLYILVRWLEKRFGEAF